MTKDEMELLWRETGCAEPLKRACWRDGIGVIPRRRFVSTQDEQHYYEGLENETGETR